MKKILLLITLIFTECYGMEANYVLSKEEKEIEKIFNQDARTIDKWLDQYSIEKLDKYIFSRFPKPGNKIPKERIKIFVKKSIQGKKVSLKNYNFVTLKNTLIKNNINDFFIREILSILMLEATVYYKMQTMREKHNKYFVEFLNYLEKTKEELKKPL